MKSMDGITCDDCGLVIFDCKCVDKIVDIDDELFIDDDPYWYGYDGDGY